MHICMNFRRSQKCILACWTLSVLFNVISYTTSCIKNQTISNSWWSIIVRQCIYKFTKISVFTIDYCYQLFSNFLIALLLFDWCNSFNIEIVIKGCGGLPSKVLHSEKIFDWIKKIICLKHFLWCKEMFCFNETKYRWIK